MVNTKIVSTCKVSEPGVDNEVKGVHSDRMQEDNRLEDIILCNTEINRSHLVSQLDRIKEIIGRPWIVITVLRASEEW